MKPILIVALVLILLSVGLFLLRRSSGRSGKGINFRKWVKNRAARQEIAEFLAARDAVEVPDDMPEKDIRELVSQVLQDDPSDDFYEDRIKLLGERATPFLMDLLRDPALAKHYDTSGQRLH